MKKCPNCFAEVPDYTVYCPRCYKKITGPAETAPKPAAAKPAAPAAAPRVANEKPEPLKAAPAAKKCPNCCKEVPDGAAFCPHCGVRLKGTVTGTASEPSKKAASPAAAAVRPGPAAAPEKQAETPAPRKDAALDQQRNEVNRILNETAQMVFSGQLKSAGENYQKMSRLAADLWERSGASQDRRMLTSLYELAAPIMYHWNPKAALECSRAIKKLWKNEPGKEADIACCTAEQFDARVCLRHTGYPEAQKYCELYFQHLEALDSAGILKRQERLESLNVRLELVERALDENDRQTVASQLAIVRSQIDETIAQADAGIKRNIETVEQLMERNLLQKQRSTLLIQYFRVSGRVTETLEFWDEAWTAYQQGWAHAMERANDGTSNDPEMIRIAHALAAFTCNGKQKTVTETQMKAGLTAARTGLEWLEKNAASLYADMDIEQMRVDLTRSCANLLVMKKDTDGALQMSNELVERLKKEQPEQPDRALARSLLDAYIVLKNVQTMIANSRFFGKKEAIRQQNITCQEAAAFAAKMHRLTGEAVFEEYRKVFNEAYL